MTCLVDEDEAYFEREEALQYYLNTYLDDEYHDDFREWVKVNRRKDFAIADMPMFIAVEDFKEWYKEIWTSCEDLYMTRGM